MAYPSQPAGWYPDPADPASEIYWNGEAWTEMRRPVAGVTAAATKFDSALGGVAAGVKSAGTGLTATWRRAGRGQRIALAAFAAAVALGLLAGLAQCSRDYGTRKDCEHYVDSHGLSGPGSLRNSLIDECVKMHKEFGVPIK